MKVKLTYFKASGKYYSEGEYVSPNRFLFDIVKEVQIFKADGKLPGLIDGAREFIIYIHPRSEELMDCVSHIIPL